MNKATIIIIMLLLPLSLYAQNLSKQFIDAGEAYTQGEYTKAIENYKSVLDNKKNNPYIEYNLANAYFRNDQVGEAIFYYRKALTQMPRNADIKFNLKYARDSVVDKIDKKSSTVSNFLIPLNDNEYIILLALLSILACGFLITLSYRKYDLIKWGCRISFIFLILASAMFINHRYNTHPFGVITSENADIYSSIGKENVVLFGLHKGAEFEIAEVANGKWVLIRLADGKKG